MTTRVQITLDDPENPGCQIRVRVIKANGKEAYKHTVMDDGDTVGFTIGKGERIEILESEDS
ncbi:MAG TPA: hypothetical protein VNJ47_10505 [Nevskiales bacterium]|nr:hypothetical protein [Nevskiales bacterium]